MSKMIDYYSIDELKKMIDKHKALSREHNIFVSVLEDEIKKRDKFTADQLKSEIEE